MLWEAGGGGGGTSVGSQTSLLGSRILITIFEMCHLNYYRVFKARSLLNKSSDTAIL